MPLASHLNPTPGQPPTPNAVNVDLSTARNLSINNLAGNVHVAIDVVGIYDDRCYTVNDVEPRLPDAAIASTPTARFVPGSTT